MNDYQQGQEHGYAQALADVRVVVDTFFSALFDGVPPAALKAALLARINTLEREEQHVPANPTG